MNPRIFTDTLRILHDFHDFLENDNFGGRYFCEKF